MDQDFLLAKKLQQQFLQEVTRVESSSPACSKPTNSIVDPQWDMVDPTPDIHTLFQVFNSKFFWNELGSVEVKWSPRMYSCAGVCTYKGRGGCVVSLSLPLLKLRPRKDLVETLLHEMIHAYLFITDRNREREEHGPKFHSHMNRINQAAGTKISVYHSFHDEVKHYRTHWWRCNGPCSLKPPYHGLVKRAMNRAPGPNDFWFAEHKLKCGGEFIKVKEPDGFKARKPKTDNNGNKENKSGQQNLDKFISPPKIATHVNALIKKTEFTNPSTSKTSGRTNIPSYKGSTPNNGRGKAHPSNSSGQQNLDKYLSPPKAATTVNTLKKTENTKTSTEKLGQANIHGFKGLTAPGKSIPGSSGSGNRSRPNFNAYGTGLLSNKGATLLEKPKLLPSTSSTPKVTNMQTTFTPYTGQGQVLNPNCKPGEINRNNSRLLKLFPPPVAPVKKMKNNEDIQSQAKKAKVTPNDKNAKSAVILVNCPVCNAQLPHDQMNEHLDMCMNLEAIMETTMDTIVVEDDNEVEEPENSASQDVRCPNCDCKCTPETINEHLDGCLEYD